MQITNKTNATWTGFEFQIIDNNGTTGGNLLHPQQAHFHIQAFDQGIGFTGGYYSDPPKNDLGTGRGVYDFVVQGGFTVSQAPHGRRSLSAFMCRGLTDAKGDVITSFHGHRNAPGARTLLPRVIGLGIAGLAGYRWCRRKKAA